MSLSTSVACLVGAAVTAHGFSDPYRRLRSDRRPLTMPFVARAIRERLSVCGSRVERQSIPRVVVRLSDVCREVGQSSSTFRRLCRESRGPQLLQLSERWLSVRRVDLDAWIKNRRQAPTDEERHGDAAARSAPAVPAAQVDVSPRCDLRRDEASRYIGGQPSYLRRTRARPAHAESHAHR